LERQVSDMLMFAKDGRLTMTSFTVAELLGNLHDAMQDRVASGTVEFDIVNRAEFAHITGNEPALRGALLNLINNAVEAGSERCAIELHLANIDSERLTIIVKDNGSGMENSVLAHIFEPFFTTKASGTGLGLAVVDSVIRAHGGRIDCESVRGCGTVFTLMLPLAAETSGVLPGGFVGSRNRSKGGRL
ncbi:MAG: sensor histidine kinase, partial [Gammaproteobacteria bacterium]